MTSPSEPLLVTGASGFIGARFVESCNRSGRPVISVDVASTFAERREHAGVDFGRILDRDEALEVLARERPALSGIVHLGACSDTTELDEDFLQRVNVEYSQALWRTAAERGLTIVYASSAATYGGGEKGFQDDEGGFGGLAPLNPYGESKRVFDEWALAEEAAGRTPPAWSGFKFFNVYGFGERHKQHMASVVVKAFDQIRANGSVKLFRSHKPGVADGHQARDFIFVDDVVDVLHFALEEPIRRGVYNLGTGRARTFLDLVRAVFAALGVDEKIEWVDTPEAIRARYQYFTQADMERLRAAGYDKPFTSLEDGVRRTVERMVAASAGV